MIPKQDCVFLTPGGILTKVEWVKDKKSFQIVNDITGKIGWFLNEACIFHPDLIFEDLLLLINKNMNLCQIIINNWVEEICDEGLKNKPKPYSKRYNKNKIEYLELYRPLNLNEPENINVVGFHGIGVELKDDAEYFHKKGDRIQWSISFTKINHLVKIPFKLNHNIKIYNEKTNDYIYFTDEYKLSSYTLFEVLYWPIWELSFYGPPKQRNKERKKIFDIKNNYCKEKSNHIIKDDYART